MPKPDDSWRQYFNSLNKTIKNFEARIEKLEKKVETLSKNSTEQSSQTSQDVAYTVPTKRKLGICLIWAGILLIFPGYIFLWDVYRYLPSATLILGTIVAGIVLMVNNPKIPQGKTRASKEKKTVDLGQDSIFIPSENDNKEKALKKSVNIGPAKKTPVKKSTLEADIGKKWLPKIGIVSIVLGVAFFIVYAIQNRWIGPTGQVALGVLAGISLIIAGEVFYRKKYENYGMTLVSGGFAIIYFAMFSAYYFYRNAVGISLTLDVVALTAVVAGAVFYSFRYDSKIIAIGAFALGYIMPLLTGSVDLFFLIYALLLTAGLCVISYHKKWIIIGVCGILAMYITHFIWLNQYQNEKKSLLHLIFIFIYLVMFIFMALNTRNVKAENKKPEWDSELYTLLDYKYIIISVFVATYAFLLALNFDKFLMVIVPLIALMITALFLSSVMRGNFLALSTIVMNYLIHFAWVSKYSQANKDIINLAFLSISLILLVILSFKNLSGKDKSDNNNLQVMIGSILAVTYFFLFYLDMTKIAFVVLPILILGIISSYFAIKYNWRFFLVGSIALSFFVHAIFLNKNFNEYFLNTNLIVLSIYFAFFSIVLFFMAKGNRIENVAGILINTFAYYGLAIWPGFRFHKQGAGLFSASIAIFYLVMSYLAYKKEVQHYFNTYLVLCFGFLTLAVPLQFEIQWVTISWAVISLILVVLSFRLKDNIIRISSSVVAIITLARLVFYDLWRLGHFNSANILSSSRLIVTLFVIITYYIIANLYYKNRNEFDHYTSYEIYVNAAYAMAATALTTLIIWLEIWDTNMALNAKKLWTSLAFVLQSVALLIVGFAGKMKFFRIMGLTLLGLAVFKVFLFDLSNLETGYRIISFIALGVIALLGGFLYNRYKEYII